MPFRAHVSEPRDSDALTRWTGSGFKSVRRCHLCGQSTIEAGTLLYVPDDFCASGNLAPSKMGNTIQKVVALSMINAQCTSHLSILDWTSLPPIRRHARMNPANPTRNESSAFRIVLLWMLTAAQYVTIAMQNPVSVISKGNACYRTTISISLEKEGTYLVLKGGGTGLRDYKRSAEVIWSLDSAPSAMKSRGV